MPDSISQPISRPIAQPRSLSDLFLTFTWLALQGFGGLLAVAQHELVERKRWLTQAEFVEEMAVAQIMPGPNVVNLAVIIGGRYFGLAGALAALCGMLALPLVVVLLLIMTYMQFSAHAGMSGALRGMGAVAAGIVLASGLRLLPTLKKNPMGVFICGLLAAACFVGVAFLRWPLIYVLPSLGLLACTVAYSKLKP